MRLFLAIESSEALRSALGALRRRLELEGSGWRWVDPDAIHLTLRFLGEVAAEEDRRARAAWRLAAAAAAPFRFRVGTLGRFPPSGRPRVLWIGLRDEPLGAAAGLAAGLEAAARAQGFPPEPRPFRAHLTLARAPRDRATRVPRALGLPRDLDDAEYDVGEVVLFRSDLQRGGARYTAVERYPLASGGDGRGAVD